ncbi:MAG: peptidoglycan-binding protein [Phycisphaerales bacterium]
MSSFAGTTFDGTDSAAQGPSNDTRGAGNYTVGAGDCVSSIAFEHGFFWKTVWDHPDNEALRNERLDPNALMPGDRLAIPKLEVATYDCATEERHKFRLKGVPAKLRMRFLDDDEPRAGEKFVILIDGNSVEGELDGDGVLDIDIPPNARVAVLKLGDDPEEHVIQLGGIDPMGTWSGIVGRLNNLGFDAGSCTDCASPELAEALRRFQGSVGLEQTGEADGGTLDKLREAHGG